MRIETERLVLRPPQAPDFEGYAALYADEGAARHIGGCLSRAAAWRKFLQMPGAWTLQGFAMFSIIERGSGEWLGQAGPWRPEGWPGNEIGWSLRREAWGKGYAAEAATAAIDWAFEHLGWRDIVHCIAPENLPSKKLAERLGARCLRMDRLPPPFDQHPCEVWGQSHAEWLENRKRLA